MIAKLQQDNLKYSWDLIQEKEKAAKNFRDHLLDLIDLLELFHLLARRSISSNNGESAENKNFKKAIQKFEMLLENAGVLKIEFPDNKASAQLCEILEVENTSDAALDGTISHIVKNGYLYKNEVLKYAQVVTFAKIN